MIWMGLGALLDLLRRGALRPSRSSARSPRARLAGGALGGAAGPLARDNARRNPQRTASTAAALMIGLALVTLVAMLAAGIIATFRGAVNELFTRDYAITAQNNFSPIPTAAAEAAAKTPGVTAVGSVRTGDGAGLRQATIFATGGRPGDAATSSTLDWKEGSQDVLANLGADGAFVDDGYAKDHDLHGRLAGRRDVRRPARPARSRSRASSIRRPAARRSAR